MLQNRFRSKFGAVFLWVVVLTLMPGCVLQEQEQEKERVDRSPVSASPRAEEYFPAEPGMRWAYVGRGNEFATHDRLATHRRDERVQIVHLSGAIVAFIYDIHPDRVVLRAIRSEIDDGTEEFLDVPDELSRVILQEPLAEGAKWRTPTFVVMDENRYVEEVRHIEAVGLTLTTPAGIFDRVIRVRVSPDQGAESLEYYAPGVGLIKTEYFLSEIPDESIVSELATFEAAME